MTQKQKNMRNNYSNIFVVLGALKSLRCFPLDIDVNDILNHCTNYLLSNCHKKAIANEQGCLSTHILIGTFHEIAIKDQSDLQTQLVLLDISSNHNVERRKSSNFVKLFAYLRRSSCFEGFSFLQFLTKLLISLKHNMIFPKFLEKLFSKFLLDNNVTSSCAH